MQFQDYQKEMTQNCKQEILDFYNHTNGNTKKFYEMIVILAKITNETNKLPTDGEVYSFMTMVLSKPNVDSLTHLKYEELITVIMGMTEKKDSADDLKQALKQAMKQ